ncbi:hypothetical protein [Corynebacterium efficiens]|nr:hypothetical protein [Corynebacterium efficiens]
MDTRTELFRLWRPLLTGVGESGVEYTVRDVIVVVPLGSEIDLLAARDG